MRFPALEQLALPATFAQIKQGKLHRDGRRYLPLIVLQIDEEAQLGIVDRHHRVAPDLVGQTGVARLVFQLSTLHIQPAGIQRKGLDRGDAGGGRVSLAPAAYGQIVALPTWEQHEKLGYHSLYTEMVIDIGAGTIGLRTNVTGSDLAAVLGTAQLQVGDWVALNHSRIDILAFISTHNQEERGAHDGKTSTNSSSGSIRDYPQ